jgi:hypothetical protein
MIIISATECICEDKSSLIEKETFHNFIPPLISS